MRPLLPSLVLALPLLAAASLASRAVRAGTPRDAPPITAGQDPAPEAPAPATGTADAAPEDAAADPTGPEALGAHVAFLCGLDPARSHEHPASLRAAADHVAATFEAAGARVERQVFEVDGERYQNVRAHLGPAEGARLVVGAHYDVCGDQPGADDNASGVAVLLGLAHALRDVELDGPVELVAYALEEPPHYAGDDMGSAHHVRALRAEGVELVGMVCLEMLGCFSDEEGSQSYPLDALAEAYGTVGDYLAVVGRPADVALARRTEEAFAEGLRALHAEWDAAAADAADGDPAAEATDGSDEVGETAADAPAPPRLRVVSLAAPRALTGVDFSDHRNFWDADLPAVMVTDTAFFRNPRYHTPEDTPETLDLGRMAQAVRGLREVVRELAGG